MKNVREFRNPTRKERDLIDILFTVNFPGKKELKKQLKNCRVRIIDTEGSFEFKIENKVKTNIKWRIPIEGEFIDTDGGTVCVLLHVVDGLAKEIEIYKKDGSEIIKYFTDKFDAEKEIKLINPFQE